jgi:hypothetical protein
MKTFAILVLAACSAFGQLPGVHQVYVMPMAGGLDQYLAEWLTREHVMQVVADPKIADAVLTDRLGEAFEQKLSEIHPVEIPHESSGVTKDGTKDGKDGKKEESAGAGGGPHNTFRSSTVRGTLFLVDAKSRQVLWSDYEKPERVTASNLNRDAERVAKKLRQPPAK